MCGNRNVRRMWFLNPPCFLILIQHQNLAYLKPRLCWVSVGFLGAGLSLHWPSCCVSLLALRLISLLENVPMLVLFHSFMGCNRWRIPMFYFPFVQTPRLLCLLQYPSNWLVWRYFYVMYLEVSLETSCCVYKPELVFTRLGYLSPILVRLYLQNKWVAALWFSLPLRMN